VSSGRLVIGAGGRPDPARLAALTAAVAALLDGERAPAPDPLPPQYRSRWRRAAIAQAVQPWSRR
jgi:Acyl-CoA carboxylase epsilon subunit